ncbi:ABC transporter substrate-binding protein [Sporomusa aerivorans]|uniref:ABC transporter substrate-binding protein n=1 Tax=Sporomusa aerivorans TaxID=204936 RepID=UPI00352AA6D6
MIRCKWLLAVIAILALFVTTACSNSTPGTAKKEKNELKVAISAAPPTLDMHKTTTQIAQKVGWHIFDTLVTLDENYKVVPMLAEKIEISPDGKTTTLALRKDIAFHNGKVMTAEDVLASLNRWRKYSALGKANLGKAEITAPDKATIVIKLPEASNAVLFSLAYPSQGASIMPKEVIDEAGDGNVKQFVGTGPFQFVEWKQDQYIHLKKFDGFKPRPEPASGLGGKREALVQDLYFIPVGDNATRVAGVQSGEYDLADEIPFDNYEMLKSSAGLKTGIAQDTTYLNLVFNKKNPLFANVKARQAVAAALDMDPIMKAVTGNPEFYTLDAGLVFPKDAWYVDNGKEKYNQKNPELAKKLLAESGYKGEPVVFLVTRDFDYMYKSSLVVKEQLEKIGVNVKLEVYDWATLNSKRSNQNGWDMFVTTSSGFREPTAILFLDSRLKWAGWYNNPQMDNLLDQIRGSANFEDARKIFGQAQALYWEDVPTVKLGNMNGLVVYRNYVKGYKYFMESPFWNVSVQ